MEPDFSFLFHQSSKDDTKLHPLVPRDKSEWPEEWTTVYYKSYDRLPKIILPETPPQAGLDAFACISKRSSKKNFTGEGLALTDLSTLLHYSCGITHMDKKEGTRRRAQPSGGARYPIEVYPLVLQGSSDLKAGLYHYAVKDHSLHVLWERDFPREETHQYFNFDWVSDASVVFIMTALFHRNQMKYGERGYRHILLEAGHIGQNIHLVSEALHLKCCALSGTKDEVVEKLLDIDGIGESLVYAVAVGK